MLRLISDACHLPALLRRLCHYAQPLLLFTLLSFFFFFFYAFVPSASAPARGRASPRLCRSRVDLSFTDGVSAAYSVISDEVFQRVASRDYRGCQDRHL